MYTWVIFLHVLSVMGFLLAHGSAAVVMFRLRSERDPARIGALLDLSRAVGGLTAATALLLLLAGLAGGFMGSWWGRGWIWASLGLFIVIGVVMSSLGRVYFERVRRALAAAPGSATASAGPAAEPVAAAIAAGQPLLVAAIGLGGLAVITWLMMFKPF